MQQVCLANSSSLIKWGFPQIVATYKCLLDIITLETLNQFSCKFNADFGVGVGHFVKSSESKHILSQQGLESGGWWYLSQQTFDQLRVSSGHCQVKCVVLYIDCLIIQQLLDRLQSTSRTLASFSLRPFHKGPVSLYVFLYYLDPPSLSFTKNVHKCFLLCVCVSLIVRLINI